MFILENSFLLISFLEEKSFFSGIQLLKRWFKKKKVTFSNIFETILINKIIFKILLLIKNSLKMIIVFYFN